jgi:hypothetical protein
VTIFIPTYQRLACLRWVLESLTRCRISAIQEPIAVYVISNYPPDNADVAALVDMFRLRDPRFAWHTISREKTLDPVESWYSAIDAHSKDGEVVLLNGDDDLFLPWSLETRYRLLIDRGADMALTNFVGRLFIDELGDRAVFTGEMPVSPKTMHARKWQETGISTIEPSFISNHVYRMTRNMKDAIRVAFAACDTQTWISRRDRTLMLPYILPFCVHGLGGHVDAWDYPCVIRGASIKDVSGSLFGVPGWNTVFANLMAYDLFVRCTFPTADLDVRAHLAALRGAVIAGGATLWVDKRISRRVVAQTLKSAEFRAGWFLNRSALGGLLTVLVASLRLTGLRLRWMLRRSDLRMTSLIRAFSS